jgi:hypothetical protein
MGSRPETQLAFRLVKEQQHAADLLRANGLIGRDVVVADAALEDVNDLVASIAP